MHSHFSGGSGGCSRGPDPPKAAIYFNKEIFIHVQGPVIISGRTPTPPSPHAAKKVPPGLLLNLPILASSYGPVKITFIDYKHFKLKR